jgi:hypothetical protein
MNEKNSFHVDLPESLRGKFRSLGRKLWLVDTVIALCGIAAGLVVSYLLLFVSDRFWSTPPGWRILFTVAGLGVAGYFVWFWGNHWIINRRNNRVLAAIVQQKHRRMGDRLMSAVELTDCEQRPENVSEALCRAAIDQIDRESESYSFNKAVATRKPFIYTILAIFILGILAAPLTYTPAASENALKRWAVPIGDEERYTFVENGVLQVNGQSSVDGIFYVPRGEEIVLQSKYSFRDGKDGSPFWESLGGWWDDTVKAAGRADEYLKNSPLPLDTDFANTFAGVVPDPSMAPLTGAKRPRFAPMKDGSVEYTLPGRGKPAELALRVGDVRRKVRIKPVARPQIDGAKAKVRYPDYLQYPPTDEGIRGTVFPYLEGSTVKFQAQLEKTAERALSKAVATATHAINSKMLEQKVVIKSDIFETAFIDLDDFREMEITWVDQYGIAGPAPWKLIFERQSDNPPHHVDCVDIAPEIAILRSDVVEIPMVGEDDYGMKELAVEWECWKRDGTNLVKKGGSALATFNPRNLSGSSTFLFDPGDKALNLPESTVVNVYAVARDYYLTDRKTRSLPVRIHILSPEEHAQLIQQNLESKMAELDDLVRREESLLDATQETQEMEPEEQSTDQTEKKIGRQEQEQKGIADELKELSEEIKELAKEALKNKEMDPTDLAKMAENAQKMQELAEQQMKQAQESLQQAQQNEQERQEKLDDAAEKEKEALEELKEMQEKTAEDMQDMYANTLVKRLRKIAEFEEGVSKDFQENFAKLIGRRIVELPDRLRNIVNEAYGFQGIYSRKAAGLQDEISRFYDATQDEKFGKVTKAMAEYNPVEKMELNAVLITKNHSGKVIEVAKELADKFKEWADTLDPQDDGGGGEGEGEGSGEPDEELIARLKELLRLRQAEMDLREKTLRLDGEAGVKVREKFEEDAFLLQFRQLELLGDLQLERDARGDGEYLPIAQSRMRDAEDELNLQGDEEGLVEAYKWALVAKARKGDVKVGETIKQLAEQLTEKQRKRAEADARGIYQKK